MFKSTSGALKCLKVCQSSEYLEYRFLTFFAGEQFDILHFRGELLAWVLHPFGLSAWENRSLCNITSSLDSKSRSRFCNITPSLDSTSVSRFCNVTICNQMSTSFAVIFKSSHFNQFKSQHMVVILVMIQQPRFILLWCDTVVSDYIKANSLGKKWKATKNWKTGQWSTPETTDTPTELCEVIFRSVEAFLTLSS